MCPANHGGIGIPIPGIDRRMVGWLKRISLFGGRDTTHEDFEGSPTQSRISPSAQCMLRQMALFSCFICDGARRNPATCGTNQGNRKRRFDPTLRRRGPRAYPFQGRFTTETIQQTRLALWVFELPFSVALHLPFCTGPKRTNRPQCRTTALVGTNLLI
jgi:hypothetical protein